MVREAAYKIKQHQGLISYGQKFSQECRKAAQRREKQQWATEKPKLDNAPKLRGIYFIDPEDVEFKEAIQKRSEKLELPMEAAMPCKVKNNHCREPCGRESDTRKSKYACIVEAHESRSKRLERNLPKDHEDRIAGRGFNSLSHYNLVPKFIPMLQAMKLRDATAAVDKEWEKLEQLPA